MRRPDTQESKQRIVKSYRPPCVVTAAYHASQANVRGIRGPYGSGKSVSNFWELFFRAKDTPPMTDGVRRMRSAIIRNTYPELISTSLATYKQWFGAVATVKMSAPITAVLAARLPDGGRIEWECLFLALDRPDDVKKLKSLELTWAFLNEVSELPRSILDAATGRVGRYPAKVDMAHWMTEEQIADPLFVPYRSGVLMDTNAPDNDHWYYKLAEEECPRGYDFFAQEPALISKGSLLVPNPKATYAKIQPKGYQYWLDMAEGKDDEWVKVFIKGQYGYVADGKPIYPLYNDAVHCAAEGIEPLYGRPLIIGLDFGLTPAAAICQVTSSGQFRVLDEVVATRAGLRDFIRGMLKPFLKDNYPGMQARIYGDPAGVAGKGTSDESRFEILAAEGLAAMPAYTNSAETRLEAVRAKLTTMIDGAPGFWLSPTCKIIRKGFQGGYKYARLAVSGEERYHNEPMKNSYSHPHDAVQYAVLGEDGPISAPMQSVEVQTATW